MKLTLTKAEMEQVLDGEYIKIGFEKHYRHNGGYETIVFKRDGKNYRTTYTWFEDDGISWDTSYTCTEVELKEVTTKEWVAVSAQPHSTEKE
jgi:hypothetical protein